MDNISLASLFIYITLSIPIKIINSQSGLTMGSGAYMVADDGSPDTIWFMGTQSGIKIH